MSFLTPFVKISVQICKKDFYSITVDCYSIKISLNYLMNFFASHAYEPVPDTSTFMPGT